MCKPFIHPVTLAKFLFLGSSYAQGLLEIIDPNHLPEEYGGTAPNLGW